MKRGKVNMNNKTANTTSVNKLFSFLTDSGTDFAAIVVGSILVSLITSNLAITVGAAFAIMIFLGKWFRGTKFYRSKFGQKTFLAFGFLMLIGIAMFLIGLVI